MTSINNIFIAAAGSGKTRHIVMTALAAPRAEKVLITTYTESNEAEIRQRLIDLNGVLPPNIEIMTWFSFLIQHGIKPYQGGVFPNRIKGMVLVNTQSGLRTRTPKGPIYWPESQPDKHFSDATGRLYSDKLSKLVIRCNSHTEGKVFARIARIYKHIFIDEVQDLAGYDLEIIVALFRSSSTVTLVGDPRQVTYLTHHESKHKKYKNGGFIQFLSDKVKRGYSIDATTLQVSHRNSPAICALSSSLYPDLPVTSSCTCPTCRNDESQTVGLFVVKTSDIESYLSESGAIQLQNQRGTLGVIPGHLALNFGASKGLGFNHVVIFPTKDMAKWLINRDVNLTPQTRARMYVALTRARYSVAVVADISPEKLPAGFSLFAPRSV